MTNLEIYRMLNDFEINWFTSCPKKDWASLKQIKREILVILIEQPQYKEWFLNEVENGATRTKRCYMSWPRSKMDFEFGSTLDWLMTLSTEESTFRGDICFTPFVLYDNKYYFVWDINDPDNAFICVDMLKESLV